VAALVVCRIQACNVSWRQVKTGQQCGALAQGGIENFEHLCGSSHQHMPELVVFAVESVDAYGSVETPQVDPRNGNVDPIRF